jgi:hypothetical protein
VTLRARLPFRDGLDISRDAFADSLRGSFRGGDGRGLRASHRREARDRRDRPTRSTSTGPTQPGTATPAAASVGGAAAGDD